MTPLRLYLHTYSLRFHFRLVPGYDVFAFIDRAVSDGFVGVCISANGPGYRHLCGTTPGWFVRVRDRIRAEGLLCDLDTSGTSPDHLRTLLDVARAVGAQQLRTYTRRQGTPQEMAALTARDLAAAAPLAEAEGVRILLENHEEFTGAEVAQIVACANSPWVGALYDYGNSMMVGEDPLIALEAMLPYVRTAHLKDHVMLADQDAPDGRLSVLGVPIGRGNLPIVEITQRLAEAGLDRVIFENVWAYRAPVRESRWTDRSRARLGAGVFAFARSPFDEGTCLPDPEALAERDPQRLVALEDEALRGGLAWLRQRLKKAGMVLA
jgi:sugar phosphate isomerase/epimerase